MKTKKYLGIDVGEVRTGVAVGDNVVKIAYGVETIHMDAKTFCREVERLAATYEAEMIVVGYPRNQSGDATAQTAFVESMVKLLEPLNIPIEYQDESLTSVMAEERLRSRKKAYAKDEIDREAAAIILQDYLDKGNI